MIFHILFSLLLECFFLSLRACQLRTVYNVGHGGHFVSSDAEVIVVEVGLTSLVAAPELLDAAGTPVSTIL